MISTAALLAIAVACIVACAFLRTRKAAAMFAVSIFLLLAFGFPLGEVMWKCARSPTSEACVWGKSLLVLTVPFGAVLGAVFGGGSWFVALGFQKRRRFASGATDSSHALHAGDEDD